MAVHHHVWDFVTAGDGCEGDRLAAPASCEPTHFIQVGCPEPKEGNVMFPVLIVRNETKLCVFVRCLTSWSELLSTFSNEEKQPALVESLLPVTPLMCQLRRASSDSLHDRCWPKTTVGQSVGAHTKGRSGEWIKGNGFLWTAIHHFSCGFQVGSLNFWVSRLVYGVDRSFMTFLFFSLGPGLQMFPQWVSPKLLG